jgi:hypothetical protein
MQNTSLYFCACLKRATLEFMLVFSIFLYTVFAMSIAAVVIWTPTVIMFSAWFPGSNNVATFLRQWEVIAGTENKLYTTYQRSQ